MAVGGSSAPAGPLGDGGWDDLVKVAVLGTARLAGRFDGDVSPERTVLASAGSLAVARKAATLPVVARELGAPAPPLDGRPPGPGMAALLPSLLADRNRAVLVEVIQRCSEVDVRFPPIALPAVLNLAAGSGAEAAALREAVPIAAGARGIWLAERNPAWSWLLPSAPVLALAEGDEGRWDLSSTDERLSMLAPMRAADPRRALELVRGAWPTERAPDRVRLLARLGPGLSLEDEPFLEKVALADRAREVRRAACRLLDRLPSSRRALRMGSRVDGVLERIVDPAVIAELPADWVADGIERGNGSVRPVACQILAATPLDHWGGDIGAAISRVTTSARGPMDDLFGALVRAAIDQSRDDWVVALLSKAGLNADARTLLRAAPVAAAADRLTRKLAEGSAVDAALTMELLPAVRRPWPTALVAEVMRRGVDIVDLGRHIPGDITPHLALIGERADPSLLPRLVPDLAALRAVNVRLERAFRDAHSLAHLRLNALACLEPFSE